MSSGNWAPTIKLVVRLTISMTPVARFICASDKAAVPAMPCRNDTMVFTSEPLMARSFRSCGSWLPSTKLMVASALSAVDCRAVRLSTAVTMVAVLSTMALSAACAAVSAFTASVRLSFAAENSATRSRWVLDSGALIALATSSAIATSSCASVSAKVASSMASLLAEPAISRFALSLATLAARSAASAAALMVRSTPRRTTSKSCVPITSLLVSISLRPASLSMS